MRERFFELLKQAETAAFSDSDFRRAAELCSAAEELARTIPDADLADRAFCNRCAYLIELDEATAQLPRLKQIILSSGDQWNRYLASYYTAVAYDLAEETDKAFPYARRAQEIAGAFDDPAMLARCANLTGTLALRSSRFDEAESAYLESLAAHRDLDGYHRIYGALAKDNLGYVMLCTDRVAAGLQLCEEARSELTQLDSEHELAQILQDLCYGYLLDDDLDRAESCGAQAFDLASRSADALIVKNLLFLLSEIAVRRGDTFRARRYLRELTEHYPEVGVSDEIIDVFLTTDLTQVVNLRG